MATTDRELQVVWFKRDLRLHDHRPLAEAGRRGPVLCLYIFEPELWQSPEHDGCHFAFIRQSLEELRNGLRSRGGELVVRIGEPCEVFGALRRHTRFSALWSHEETGNALTYARDRRVADWTRTNGITWSELPQNGVVRPLHSRDGWSRNWQRRMTEERVAPPNALRHVPGIDPGALPTPEELGCRPNTKADLQPGGEEAAHRTLESFLTERGVGYRKEMSSPLTGEHSCSRLSPHLAWGTLSLRTAYQRTRERVRDLQEARELGQTFDKRWLQALGSFEGRLRWHCHFMQKLEDEPSIEFRNMNRAYDGLREGEFREDRFEAWCRGETGYPMVDACMRALHATGWINFRMRAMLVSFAAYHLWLHWRRPAVHLAQHFLDFEPGIHFSQFQMQSGVTGINALRIYSPAKQVIDQDPHGEFIRRHCPELADVPAAYLPEPHRMPASVQREACCIIGRHYPRPVVDHRQAYAEARKRMGDIRRKPETREASLLVQEKHGSRKRPARKRR